MIKLFNIRIESETKELEHINNIRRAASRISLGEVKEYRKQIEHYLRFLGTEIKSYLGNDYNDYYVITIYNSFLIENAGLKRITVLAEAEEEEYIIELKAWYDRQCKDENAFTLVPISLEAHNKLKRPNRYVVIMDDKSAFTETSLVSLDISCCYKKECLWNGWLDLIKNKKFDEVLKEMKTCCIQNNCDCLDAIVRNDFTINDKKITRDQILPFIIVWYPIYKEKEFKFQYYIPSPMLSDTPVGGLVIGTKEQLSEDALDNLADIALKSVIEINFLEHKEKVMQQSRRTAVSAVMGRNMSHNIGSHVLATLTNKEYISKNPQSVIAFNSYLQKRMDLIARMAGGQTASGEPMYFVGDLLNGFFKQTLLLNHLVKDLGGFEKNRIIFKVCLNDDTAINFTYQQIDDKDCKAKNNTNDDCMRWLPDKGATLNDFLVSIPDGEIGCQALYVFLESMMRNSAKYGLNKNAKEFQITIKVEDNNGYYRISICDNLSLCQDDDFEGNVAAGIRSEIEKPLVDNNGQLSAKSLGIAEMRAACEFLMKPFDEKYPAYTAYDGKKYPLGVACPGPNDCHRALTINAFECEKGQCCNHLTYIFCLMKPQIVAVISDNNGIKDNEKYGIKQFSNLSALIEPENSYQFVTVYITDTNKQEIIQTLKSHYALPFRILIVKNNTEIDFELVNDIPPRRVTICPAQDICIQDTSQNAGAENFIVSVYKAWIRNRWLNKNKCFNMVLAFQRDDQSEIFKRYETIGSLDFISDKVTWSVYRTYQNGSFQAELKYGQKPESTCKYLIYDNHSAFKKAQADISNPDFHHLTGEENNKIFEALASPPANDFSFKYFLLSVLEASLTKVVIIDERVAEACIDETKEYDISRLNELNNCRCYPLFKIANDALNTAINDKMNNCSSDNKKSLSELICDNNSIKCVVKNENGSINITEADLAIIHYGLIETHEGLRGEDFKKLYSLAPSIVITSGRGAGTIKKGNDDTNKLPFIEASILKDNTYPSISKYHLTRAIMSIKGEA